MEKTEEILKTIYLFSKFNERELSLLAAKIKKVDLNVHGLLFSEGSTATSMYVVKYGTLKVTTNSKEGDDVKLTTIAAGQHLGEFPFLDGENRSANVEAIEKTELLELSYKDLNEVLTANKDMELKFYKELGFFLVKRLRVLTTDITQAREIKKRYM
ncbi:MAG: cyclic nucleotide-binding domain-containing protein [Leptospiraceae bacterium]|nr:cyclic nucleotide-binding domain-containing protein [Leptospiraceae bacterium]